ncbi:hypothetical protein AB1L88_11040 [Tautonia sp. JC769]|uniref:hypothetical protein n=1 Tax=Tautonia sp. JC769 TaxID=3232135 RepID=UPI003457E7DB
MLTVRHRLRVAAFFVTLVLPLQSAQAVGHDGPDLDAIRAAIERAWSSVQTLHFRSEELCWDSAGQFSLHKTIDYTLGVGDQRIFKEDSLQVSRGSNSHRIQIEDGTTYYGIALKTQDPRSISQVKIEDQESTRGNHPGFPGCAALWLWTPGGRPLHEYLQSGGRLEVVRTPDGSEQIILIAEGKFGQPIRCELDPEHDYLPRRINYADIEWQATAFRCDGGRWFPARGKMIDFRAGKDRLVAEINFVVTELQINQPIAEDIFDLPELPDDVLIKDERGRKP